MPIEANVDARLEVSKALNKIGALQFGAFKLTSGKISPYYIDLRVVPSFPDAFQQICNLESTFVRDKIGEKNFKRIAGIPIAGMPFATTIAFQLRKPFLYIRRGIKLHGRQRRIEGILAPGDQVLLVDDLITTGLSLRKAAKSITAEGGVVKDAVVLIDRQEGGKAKLEKENIKVHSLLSISEILKNLSDVGAITEEQAKTILRQIRK